MGNCGHDKARALDALRERQGKTLRIVLAINVMLFLRSASHVIAKARGEIQASPTASFGDN